MSIIRNDPPGYWSGVWPSQWAPPTVATPEERTSIAEQLKQAQIPAKVKVPSLKDYADHELVMEMIGRGYAVALMPAEELAEEVTK